MWEAGTGQEVLALKERTEMVWSVAFSPDGKRIVTGVAGAGATAKVWYAAPMRQMAALEQEQQASEEGLPPGRNEH